MAGWLSTACSMSAKRPSTCGPDRLALVRAGHRRRSCRPRCRNGSTRTTPAVRQNRLRRRARRRSAPWLRSGRAAAAAAALRRLLSRFRCRRRLLVCGIVGSRRHARLARGFAAIDKARGIPGVDLLLRTQRELLLRCLLGAKFEHRARRFAARRQIGGDEAGLRTLQIGKQGAARIGGNGGNRIARRAEAEPVQRERRRFFSTSGHGESSRDERARWQAWDVLLWRKLRPETAKSRCFLTFCSSSRAGHAPVETAPCGAATALVSI